MNTFSEIWHVSVDVRSAPGHQIWPLSVKGSRYRKFKFAQNCGFWPPEGDTMNTFRWNLACKCRRPVCFRTPNLTLSGKREPVQESPKIQNLPDTMNTFRLNLARKCRRSVCFSASNLTFIGNRGSVQEPPKSQNLPKIVVFGHWKLTQWTLLDEIWHVSVDVRSALGHQLWR